MDATGQEFIAYVMVGNGCDCNEDLEQETTTVMELEDANEFEALESEGFEDVLDEVRASFAKLLSMFFLSLSKEVVVYHNGVLLSCFQHCQSRQQILENMFFFKKKVLVLSCTVIVKIFNTEYIIRFSPGDVWLLNLVPSFHTQIVSDRLLGPRP